MGTSSVFYEQGAGRRAELAASLLMAEVPWLHQGGQLLASSTGRLPISGCSRTNLVIELYVYCMGRKAVQT